MDLSRVLNNHRIIQAARRSAGQTCEVSVDADGFPVPIGHYRRLETYTLVIDTATVDGFDVTGQTCIHVHVVEPVNVDPERCTRALCHLRAGHPGVCDPCLPGGGSRRA